MNKKLSVAIVGGTGPQGRGLALRMGRAGHPVLVGSRDPGRAREAAAELSARLGSAANIQGHSNLEATRRGETVVLAVPHEGHDELVATLADAADHKIVISCVNPLTFDKDGPLGRNVPEGSAAEAAARLLPGSRVVGAFHHLSAVSLESDELLEDDVMVCGDDPDAREAVCRLAVSVTGRAGIEVGPLRLARHLEPMTAVLISLNRLHKAHAGLRVAGVPPTRQLSQVLAS